MPFITNGYTDEVQASFGFFPIAPQVPTVAQGAPQKPNYKRMPGKSKTSRHSTVGSEPDKWEASSLVDVANIPYSRSNRQV